MDNQEIVCPRCSQKVDSLQAVDPSTQELLGKKSGENVPSSLCFSCYRELSTRGSGAAGSTLMAQEKAKEQRKLMLWKSRVNLVKKGRALMAEKAFSDAAVAFEKYVRVLEVVFDSKPGELTPEKFKDSARTQELTVVASVYWDLMRIYDTSEKYGDRQMMAAQKLAEFLKFTPIYPDIVRRADSFAKTAKNPAAFRKFLQTASETKGRCFIATSAFSSPVAPEVMALQRWRDRRLALHPAGQFLVVLYESLSPPLASLLDRHPGLKPPVRAALRRFARWVQAD